MDGIHKITRASRISIACSIQRAALANGSSRSIHRLELAVPAAIAAKAALKLPTVQAR
jgi:hypothetical protein